MRRMIERRILVALAAALCAAAPAEAAASGHRWLPSPRSIAETLLAVAAVAMAIIVPVAISILKTGAASAKDSKND